MIQFKAKDLKTGEEVIGNLVYVERIIHKKAGIQYDIVPYILKMKAQGGMFWVTKRYQIDENTLTIIN